jgi:hypothetical protein
MAAFRVIECDAIAVIVDEKICVKVRIAISAVSRQPHRRCPSQFFSAQAPDILDSGQTGMVGWPPHRSDDGRGNGHERDRKQTPRAETPG